jgi:hypothetical protein
VSIGKSIPQHSGFATPARPAISLLGLSGWEFSEGISARHVRYRTNE